MVFDRFAAVSALAETYSSTVVLKGAGTLVAQSRNAATAGAGLTSVCPYGNAVLATAGSGDVLAGVIGSLLARGMEALSAAELGVCLHALAADSYLRERGAFGLTASDLPAQIATTMNTLAAAASQNRDS